MEQLLSRISSLFHFLWLGEAVPGWSRAGVSLALSELLDFPFSSFLSLPSVSDPAAAAAEGTLGGNVDFSRHSPDVTFPKPFLHPGWPRVIPAGTSRAPGLAAAFPAGPGSLLGCSVHPHSGYSMVAVELQPLQPLQPLEPLFQGFPRVSIPCRARREHSAL